MTTYQSVHLSARPDGHLIPSKVFELKSHPAPTKDDLQDGEVILRVYYLSVDPAMRGWLDDKRSYHTPVQIGEVMHGFGLGKVESSKSTDYPVGTYAACATGWSEVVQIHESKLLKVVQEPWTNLSDNLGILGFTGMTAYFGMIDVGKVQQGNLVVVTGAAGATGSIAGQIAKMRGARVVGVTGSDEKCSWLKSIGFDEALNYKDPDFTVNFDRATHDLIDVFFDNVGGPILDHALTRAKPHARFAMCGAVSQHNGAGYGLKNYLMVTRMRIHMVGFIIFDFQHRFKEAQDFLSNGLQQGFLHRKETIVKGGLAEAGNALASLYSGVNTGKLLVQITD